MKKSFYLFTLLAVLVLLPASGFAAEKPTTAELFKLVSGQHISNNSNPPWLPTVLGINTSDEASAPVVPAELGDRQTSVFSDVEFQAPEGWEIWYEDIEEGTLFSTYVVNEALTAQLAIFRSYDESVTVESVVEEIENICEICGYEILDKSESEVSGADSVLIDYLAEDMRFQDYVFAVDGVTYVVELTAYETEWGDYEEILLESLKSVTVVDAGAIIDFDDENFNTFLGSQGDIFDSSELDELLQLLEEEEFEIVFERIHSAVIDPETVPFLLFPYSGILFDLYENREQAAFVFYLAQLRTRPYVIADQDPTLSASLRSELSALVSEEINEWAGSDIWAWKRLPLHVMNFELQLGDPVNVFDLPEDEWQKIVAEQRADYLAGFEEYLMPVTAEEWAEQRTENGLTVGPWEDPGDPLPEDWR